MWERELDGEATCNYIQCSIVGGRGGGGVIITWELGCSSINVQYY